MFILVLTSIVFSSNTKMYSSYFLSSRIIHLIGTKPEIMYEGWIVLCTYVKVIFYSSDKQ